MDAVTLVALLLAGTLCSLVGTWLVVQREGMTADGISHGVLPGLVLAFIVAGTRHPVPMVIGGVISGVLTVALTRALDRIRGVPADAALGASFSIFFALGALLVTRFADMVDLDPGCVLYGLAEMIPLETVAIGSAQVPVAIMTLVPALLVTAILLGLLRKELFVASFDRDFGQMTGLRPHAIRLLHTVLVAVVCVVCFEIVGSILVVALIVGPAATARLFAGTISRIQALSLGFTAVGVTAGYALAVGLNTSIGGSIGLSVGLLFGLALVVRQFAIRRDRTRAA